MKTVQCRLAVGSLYPRSRSAPQSEPKAKPKGGFNGIGNAPRYSYSCYSSIFHNSVIVVYPHCYITKKKVFEL